MAIPTSSTLLLLVTLYLLTILTIFHGYIQVVVATTVTKTNKPCYYIYDTDYRGKNNTSWRSKRSNMTKEECCELCVNTIGCDFSVLAGPNKPQPGQCFFKTNGAVPFYSKGDISCCPYGEIGCPSPPNNDDVWELNEDFSDEFQASAKVGILKPIDTNKWYNVVPSWSEYWTWSSDNIQIVQTTTTKGIKNETHNFFPQRINTNEEVLGSYLALTMTYNPHIRDDADDKNNKKTIIYYKSAILKSKLPKGIQYGRFEARIKGASRWPGVCPAWWGWRHEENNNIIHNNKTNKDYWIELDFVEMQENKDNKQDIDFTTHVFPPSVPKEINNSTHWKAPFDPKDEFHIYSMEWNESKLTWWVDDTMVKQIPTNQYFNAPNHFIDIAISFGLRPPLKTLPSSYGFPTTFYVDWIRVWQKREMGD